MAGDTGRWIRRQVRRALLDAASSRRARDGIRVLGYHMMPPPAVLRSHVEAIRSVAELIDEWELLTLWSAVDPPAAGGCRVLLTFDDAYRQCLDVSALALTERLGLRPTVFAVAAAVDPSLGTPRGLIRDGDGLPHPLGSTADLRNAIACGWSIGSHTSTHWDCARGGPEDLQREIVGSKAALESALGVEVRSFAYPWGRPANIGIDAKEMVRRGGYDASFTTRRGVIDSARRPSPHLLPRDVVESWWGARELLGCLAGGLDRVPMWR